MQRKQRIRPVSSHEAGRKDEAVDVRGQCQPPNDDDQLLDCFFTQLASDYPSKSDSDVITDCIPTSQVPCELQVRDSLSQIPQQPSQPVASIPSPISTPIIVDESYKSDRVEYWSRPVAEKYPLPPYLSASLSTLPFSCTLPFTKKDFDLLLYTAKAIREKGTPFEIVLKVKLSDINPKFDFLNIDSTYHSLYRYLRDLPEEEFWNIFLWREIPHIENPLSMLASYEEEEREEREQLPQQQCVQLLDGIEVTGSRQSTLSAAEMTEKKRIRLEKAKIFAEKQLLSNKRLKCDG